MRDIVSDPFKTKPWMYSKPTGENMSKLWVEEWKTVLLEVAEINNLHLVNKLDLKNMQPFDKLSTDSFEELIESLLGTGYLTYWGKGNLRIYWKSIQAWTDNLIEKAKSMDRVVIFGFEALEELDPRMTEIPRSDIDRIFNTAVNAGRARWVEKENLIIKVL